MDNELKDIAQEDLRVNLTRNLNFNKRRITNAGKSIKHGDYVTRGELVLSSTLNISGDNIEDGSIIAAKLTENVLGWITDIVFSATDFNTVQWTSGTITFADGTSYSLNSGNTGNMSGLNYIYFNSDSDINDLFVTTSFATVVGENLTLLCIAKPALVSNQEAFFIPAVGVFGINETVIGANSISTGKIQASAITTNLLNANAVTAAKIDVASLTAISISAFTISGEVIQGAIIRTSSSNPKIQLDSTDGLRGFDSSGNVLFQITTGGVATIKSANSGNRIEIDATNGLRVYNATGLISQFEIGNAIGYLKTSVVKGMGGSFNGNVGLETATASNAAISLSESSSLINLNAASQTRLVIHSAGVTVSNGIIAGDGSGLTNLAAGNIASGTLNSARLDTDVVKTTGTQSISGAKTFSSDITMSSANVLFSSGFGIASSSTYVVVHQTNGVESGHSGTVVARFATGECRLYIGGTLWTLSVDGSGFVKAA